MEFLTTAKLKYKYSENGIKFYTLKNDLISVYGKDKIIVPKELYYTDLASIPIAIKWFLKKVGLKKFLTSLMVKTRNSAITHDYLTDDRKFPLLKAHWYFYLGMKEDKVNFFIRSTFFISVFCFGWIPRYF